MSTTACSKPGGCGCAGGSAWFDAPLDLAGHDTSHDTTIVKEVHPARGARPLEGAAALAQVNGVPLHAPGQRPDDPTLRQRACSELLRQAAQQAGLLAHDDPAPADGVLSEAATLAIEALLERELAMPTPSEEACRRYHAAHAARFRAGTRVRARHVLFGVTPGVDVAALRRHAEGVLLELRCHDGDAARADTAFAQAAARWSNCPSSAEGGHLGWLGARDCAPEFARALFDDETIGVLPQLVHSRFGLHVVEVLARDAGRPLPFESVRSAVELTLQQQSYATALRQYLRLLAGRSRVEGVDMEAADTPLVQ